MGDIILKLRTVPPHTIIVERIQLHYKGFCVDGDEMELKIDGPGISNSTLVEHYVHDTGRGLILDPMGNGRGGVGMG
jgi:hypothetical protein